MMQTKKLLRNSLAALAATALLLNAGDAAAKKKMVSKARPAFDKGDNTIAIGLGLGSIYSYSGASFIPAGVASFDHGIIANVGPGTIGIGGMVGYSYAHYDYFGYKDTWTNIVFAVRGTYHLTILKDKNNKFDPYGGVNIGVRTYNYKDDLGGYSNSQAYGYFGPFVGAKYNFVPAFGVWAEVGYNVAPLQIGINFNF